MDMLVVMLPAILFIVVAAGWWWVNRSRKNRFAARKAEEEQSREPEVLDRTMLMGRPRASSLNPQGWGDDTPQASAPKPKPPKRGKTEPPPEPAPSSAAPGFVLDRAFLEARQRQRNPGPSADQEK